jgi:hypothetical protein
MESRDVTFQNFLTAILLVGSLLIPLRAQAVDPLETARNDFLRLTRLVEDRDRAVRALSAELDRRSTEIHTLKRNQDRNPSMLRQYRLQTQLQEAQELSVRLTAMTEEARESEHQLRAARARMVVELDRAIESLRVTANSNTEPLAKRRASAQAFEQLLVERMRLSSEPSGNPFPSDTATLLRNDVSPEDAAERLNALHDLERRMEGEIASLTAETSELRRQRFLRTELNHLMDEEAFFAEQGFVRGGTARPNTTALSKTGTSVAAAPVTAPSVAAPAAIPSVSAPGVTVPGSDTAPTGGDTRSAPSTRVNPTGDTLHDTEIDKVTRDPLAQLASEFGLPLDQKRDLQGRGTTPDRQLQWLEDRIATIRLILDRLRLKTREFELQLPRR